MKKCALFILALCMAVTAAACSGNQNPPQQTPNDGVLTPPATTTDGSDPFEQDHEATDPSRILIAYFTMPEPSGMDAVSGASRVVVDGEVVGSTQLVARWINEATGGELFAIETVQDYPAAHDELTAFADAEKETAARPELAAEIENLDDYDVIFIGYPNWWGDLPMPMYSFFEVHDFAGKTIIPFNTNGGSGFSRTIDTISELEPDATLIPDGITVSRNDVADAKEDVLQWLRDLDIASLTISDS